MSVSDPIHNPDVRQKLPNLRHLRILDVAVRERSMLRAAQSVHISQPAASQAMARLRQVFGARLMERVGNAVVVTPEGRIVVARARRALGHLGDLGPLLRQRTGADRVRAASLLERYASTSQLRALATVAATGSFAAAARRLGQSDSSLQRACREIERIMGLALFEGGQQARVLSAAGQVVAARASLALKELATAHAELRERAGLFDGRLVIGALPLSRTRLLPEAVVRLMNDFPDARIEIIDGAYEKLVEQLCFGNCDLIVGALRGADRAPGLNERTLFQDTLHIVARHGHPLAGRRLAGEELRHFPWILPRRDSPARRVFESFASAHGLSTAARGHVETGSLVALRGILMRSDALTLISLRQIGHEVAQNLLVPLDFEVSGTSREIGVTELSGVLPTRLHAAFMDHLAAVARLDRPATIRALASVR
ncbi:MAG: LysR family transcriptional regulator [Pararhodobacter sp.]|nr:LysR family transcriptional regulator [Pararhodobacter sp.]